MRTTQTRQASGFTLIEVLIALAVAGIAISMFGYLINSLRLTRVSKLETEAAAYARNYLDTLRGQWRFTNGYENPSEAAALVPPEGYTVTVNIENQTGDELFTFPGPAPATDTSPMRTVTINLTHSQEAAVTMSTKIARPPASQ